MVRISEISGDVVGIWTDGDLEEEELRQTVSEIKRRLPEQASLRLLARIDGTKAWQAEALVDLIRFSRRERIRRMAVVGRACDACTIEFVALIGMQLALFEPEQMVQAWEWLRTS